MSNQIYDVDADVDVDHHHHRIHMENQNQNLELEGQQNNASHGQVQVHAYEVDKDYDANLEEPNQAHAQQIQVQTQLVQPADSYRDISLHHTHNAVQSPYQTHNQNEALIPGIELSMSQFLDISYSAIDALHMQMQQSYNPLHSTSNYDFFHNQQQPNSYHHFQNQNHDHLSREQQQPPAKRHRWSASDRFQSYSRNTLRRLFEALRKFGDDWHAVATHLGDGYTTQAVQDAVDWLWTQYKSSHKPQKNQALQHIQFQTETQHDQHIPIQDTLQSCQDITNLLTLYDENSLFYVPGAVQDTKQKQKQKPKPGSPSAQNTHHQQSLSTDLVSPSASRPFQDLSCPTHVQNITSNNFGTNKNRSRTTQDQPPVPSNPTQTILVPALAPTPISTPSFTPAPALPSTNKASKTKRFTVHLKAANAADKKFLQNEGYNPKVLIVLRGHRPLIDIVDHLETKWSSALQLNHQNTATSRKRIVRLPQITADLESVSVEQHFVNSGTSSNLVIQYVLDWQDDFIGDYQSQQNIQLNQQTHQQQQQQQRPQDCCNMQQDHSQQQPQQDDNCNTRQQDYSFEDKFNTNESGSRLMSPFIKRVVATDPARQSSKPYSSHHADHAHGHDQDYDHFQPRHYSSHFQDEWTNQPSATDLLQFSPLAPCKSRRNISSEVDFSPFKNNPSKQGVMVTDESSLRIPCYPSSKKLGDLESPLSGFLPQDSNSRVLLPSSFNETSGPSARYLPGNMFATPVKTNDVASTAGLGGHAATGGAEQTTQESSPSPSPPLLFQLGTSNELPPITSNLASLSDSLFQSLKTGEEYSKHSSSHGTRWLTCTEEDEQEVTRMDAITSVLDEDAMDGFK